MFRHTLLCFTLLLLTHFSTRVLAQNIGQDLRRVVELAPEVRQLRVGEASPALDEIVTTLAYYAAAPDTAAVRALFDGPALVTRYADNPGVRDFFVREQLDVYLQAYVPPPGLRLPGYLGADQRMAYLQKLPGNELFSRGGRVDLNRIRTAMAAPPVAEQGLKKAAAGARRADVAPTAQLIGNALAGLSDWISRRAQEELTYTFLTRLRDDISRNGLDHLFPETSDFLPRLDLLNYKAILPSIRKAFVADLGALAYNLGNYLDARYPGTFRDPVLYNVFLLYRMLDLDVRGVPLPEILGFVYGELEETRTDVRRRIDLRMAEFDATTPGYAAVQRAFDQVATNTDSLNARFRTALDKLSEDQYNRVADALDEAGLPEEDFFGFADQIEDIYGPVNDAELPLRSNYWEEDSPRAPAAGIVRAWLDGREAYEYYAAYPTLTRYDKFFGPDAKQLAPDQLRAAGLTAAREVLAQATALPKYQQLWEEVSKANMALARVRSKINERQRAVAVAQKSRDDLKTELLADIDAEYAFAPEAALAILRKLTEEVTPSRKGGRAELLAIRERLNAQVRAAGRSGSPLAAKLRPPVRTSTYFPDVQQSIDRTAAAFQSLQNALTEYSAAHADSLVVQYHNLTTFETVFGMAQQVFFLLSDGERDGSFVPRRALGLLHTDPAARELFAGVARERLRLVSGLGQFSTPGLTDFLLDFGQYLADFQATPLLTEAFDDPTAARRVATVDFITQTLSALLSAPLLNPAGTPGQPKSLAERFPAFGKVPAIAGEINELFRQSESGQFRYAIDNLLELIRLFDLVPPASRKERRLRDRQRDLLGQIEAHVVREPTPELATIGLALPDGRALPAPENRRDQATLQTYQRQLATAGLSADERADTEDAVRQLKIKRLQEQLLRVGDRLERLDSTRQDGYRNKLFRYGTFMADVAAATNAADFESALNSVALPVGSSQIKRNRPSSLELGAYFGAAISGEQLVLPAGVDVPELEETTLGAALFVPIGVSYSFNIGGRKSVTLFGSVIDLGALTAFRLEDRDAVEGARVDRLPEFRPANVIAPGFHVMYNFPKSPISLGVGVQDGPSVRNFTLDGSNTVRDARSVRGMVTLSVDVPIFRFFNN